MEKVYFQEAAGVMERTRPVPLSHRWEPGRKAECAFSTFFTFKIHKTLSIPKEKLLPFLAAAP